MSVGVCQCVVSVYPWRVDHVLCPSVLRMWGIAVKFGCVVCVSAALHIAPTRCCCCACCCRQHASVSVVVCPSIGHSALCKAPSLCLVPGTKQGIRDVCRGFCTVYWVVTLAHQGWPGFSKSQHSRLSALRPQAAVREREKPLVLPVSICRTAAVLSAAPFECSQLPASACCFHAPPRATTHACTHSAHSCCCLLRLAALPAGLHRTPWWGVACSCFPTKECFCARVCVSAHSARCAGSSES